MKRIKFRRPDHASVVAYLALFLALTGGVAYAAGKIGSHQIKKNAITTAKIKKNAVNGSKVKNQSLTGSDINVSTLNVSRVVTKLRGSSTLALTGTLQIYPLDSTTYQQAANENNSYISAVDVTFAATCTGTRQAIAYLLVDPSNPLVPTISDVAGAGQVSDTATGQVSRRLEIGPYPAPGVSSTKFEPGTARTHSIYIVVSGGCGGGSGVNATFGGVDVVGTR